MADPEASFSLYSPILRLTRQPAAVILDMDGLLLDTERIVRQLFMERLHLFSPEDRPLPEISNDKYAQLLGRNRTDGHALLHEWLGEDYPVAEMWDSIGHDLMAQTESMPLPTKAGVRELLTLLQEKKILRAVATSTGRKKAELCLKSAGIWDHFNTIVAGDEIARGKPEPDIYLEAAMRLDTPPAECLAFEDSHAGVRAAKAAGMTIVMVPDLQAPTAEIGRISDAVIESLEIAWAAFHQMEAQE